MILCVCRLSEDGAQVPKHVGLIRIMNYVLGYVFYCILLSVFVGHNTEYTKMHGMSSIKKKKIKSMLQLRICCVCTQINNKRNIIIIIIIAAASVRRAEDYQTARCHIAVRGHLMTTIKNYTVTHYVDGILEKNNNLVK